MNLARHPLFIWFPFFFGIGVLAHFFAPADLSITVCSVVFIGVLAGYFFTRVSDAEPLWQHIWLAFVLIASGVLLTTGRTEYIAAHRLEIPFTAQETRREVRLVGTLAQVERRHKDTLLLLDIADFSEDTTRYGRVRVYARGAVAEGLRAGCAVDMQVDLRAIRGPVVLGGYDPRLPAFYDGVIASGFLGQVVARDCTAWQQGTQLERFFVQLERFRADMSARFHAHLSDAASGVASALFLGIRGQSSSELRDAFRDSGLAHVLAISGLHMALLTGGVYAALRWLLAIFPWLVLRIDIRKICAFAALLVATGYLLVSGASVATQRAYVMVFFFLIAILLNRPAISLRNLAWAGLVILLIRPESIMQAGFQMSFAATLALIGLYQQGQNVLPLAGFIEGHGRLARFARRILYYVAALVVSSVVAGFVTGLIAAVHFNRFSSLGLFANLAAMPVLGMLVMPFGFLSFPALLFYERASGAVREGLDIFLSIFSAALDFMIGVARYFGGFDISRINVAGSSGWVVLLVFAALAFLCMTEKPRRVGAAFCFLLALLLVGGAPRPEAYILGQGYRIAIRDADGVLGLVPGRGGNFYITRWYEQEGVSPTARKSLDNCVRDFCMILARDGHRIAIARSTRAITQTCNTASLVITRRRVGNRPCAATLLSADNMERNRVTAIRYTRGVFRPYQMDGTGARAWQR